MNKDSRTAKPARMGRPPLNMKILNVRLPPEVIEEIDGLVGAYRRPQFIREAVEREIERRKKEK
ncbi:ribbon-helix-helix domain-containing protein [Sphingobium sp. YR768]|uniref:ribbon-helix-helix domain-containing protein n=1 Tax=Sphingobium sp. YR768 TaxID=1884365 RepID=UPI00115FE0C7|nr:ribbon-helix-helix domain-containing protein [Sphingobium sp. YR768]